MGHEEYFWSSLTRLTLLMETERTQRVRRRSKNTEFTWKKKKVHLGRDFSSHQSGEAVNQSITLMDQLMSPRGGSSEGAALSVCLSVSVQISSGGRCGA